MQWHILDHALETLLEAGQIPHISLFTEMICQLVVQQEYERTIPLINSMVHASMQFCERRWTSHFEKNMDRIGESTLQGLLEFLDNSRSKILAEEEPVSSLIKSLRYLCCGQRKLVTKSVSHSELFPRKSISVSDYHSDTKRLNEQDSMLVGSRENYKGLPSERKQLHAAVRSIMEEDVYEEPNDYDYAPQDDISGVKIDETWFPSASDILETWKEERIKDNIFPFHV